MGRTCEKQDITEDKRCTAIRTLITRYTTSSLPKLLSEAGIHVLQTTLLERVSRVLQDEVDICNYSDAFIYYCVAAARCRDKVPHTNNNISDNSCTNTNSGSGNNNNETLTKTRTTTTTTTTTTPTTTTTTTT